ncbi:hypothetical protein [Amaricoccus solimangrovi]|uniref:hypothetical protein n=1 Tax=Amaricoccus solimangrovi TaxID=2589815 RepID=UPI0015E3323E|nr:hypothetical protein [Amaricoccus solimangrovi]
MTHLLILFVFLALALTRFARRRARRDDPEPACDSSDLASWPPPGQDPDAGVTSGK